MSLLIAGCQSYPLESHRTKETFPAADHLFGEEPELPSPSEIHHLNSEEVSRFLAYYNDPGRAHIPEHRRLFEYLDRLTEEFDYYKDTYTAQEALDARSGNCLSLAILTTALANLVGVPVEYQLVESDPVYTFAEEVVLKGVHLRTKLVETGESEEGIRYLWRPGTIVDYFPDGSEKFIGNVSSADYLSRYYVNIAVAAVQANEDDRAYWLAKKALTVFPNSEDATNVIALLYKRKGELELAEATYRYALAINPSALIVIRNYRNLLVSEGRRAEARLLEKQLDSLELPNPYRWYVAGNDSLAAGELKLAKRYFERALKIAPYIHQIHFGLAKIYYRLGQLDLVREHLGQAKAASHRPALQRLYEAKLMALAKHQARL